eukprot:TRINITY_DN182_c0_g1_i4.p1 TRINITY_DN182_c0_g1~~TRINITY_DN182_c0_g1_i4.p1  ORF type:complete len:151 (-),score=22.43 TRINITY_DN182_c0_g1_i4:177-629(-)
MNSPTQITRGESPPMITQGSPDTTIQPSLKGYFWCNEHNALCEEYISDDTILQLPSDFIPPLDLDAEDTSTSTLSTNIQNSIQNNNTNPQSFSIFSNSTDEWNFYNATSPPFDFNLDCEVSLADDFIQQILNPNFGEESSQNSTNLLAGK